jgi:hypothetical protein
MNRKNVPLCMLTAALLFSGCTLSQQVVLGRDGSGTARVRVELAPVFLQYLQDLAELTGASKQPDILAPEKIAAGFPPEGKIALTRISSPEPTLLDLELAFPPLEELFADSGELAAAGILSHRRQGQTRSFELHLNRDNFTQLTELFPVLDNPLFEGLGPRENDQTSEEEYLELIELALGDEGDEALEASYLELVVQVEGEIVSQKGGEIVPGGVRYRIPLIRVLLLDKPLDYSLIYR